MTSTIPLASVLRDLRRDLSEAMRETQNSELLFRLGPIDLELQVELMQETAGKGGVKFWVVKAGAEHSQGRTNLHTLRLRLEPVTRDGRNVLVSDASVTEPPG